MAQETCSVCDEPFPQDNGEELDMFDPDQKVHTDTDPHHLGCTSELMAEVHCASDELPDEIIQ